MSDVNFNPQLHFDMNEYETSDLQNLGVGNWSKREKTGSVLLRQHHVRIMFKNELSYDL